MRSILLTSLIILHLAFIVIAHHHCHCKHDCHKHKCCKKEVHHHHDHEGKKVYHKHGHGHGHKHSHHHANHHHHHHTGGGHEHSHTGHSNPTQHHTYTVTRNNQLANQNVVRQRIPSQGSLLNNYLTGGAAGNGGGTAYLLQRGQGGNDLYQAVQSGVQNNQQGVRTFILQQPGLAEMAKQGQLSQVLKGQRVIIV